MHISTRVMISGSEQILCEDDMLDAILFNFQGYHIHPWMVLLIQFKGSLQQICILRFHEQPFQITH